MEAPFFWQYYHNKGYVTLWLVEQCMDYFQAVAFYTLNCNWTCPFVSLVGQGVCVSFVVACVVAAVYPT